MEAAYTAFGERVGTAQNRYGFAGAHGYQTETLGGDDFMHLGARYYNPSTGRFLQRDPIGVKGGLNVYVYVLNRPTAGLDPTGHGFLGGVWTAVKIIGGAVGTVVGGALILSGGTGAVAAGIVIVVVALIIEVSGIRDLFPAAQKIVAPITPGVRNRNREVLNEMDCLGMGDD